MQNSKKFCIAYGGDHFISTSKLLGIDDKLWNLNNCSECGTGTIFPRPTYDDLKKFYTSKFLFKFFYRLLTLTKRWFVNFPINFLIYFLNLGGNSTFGIVTKKKT